MPLELAEVQRFVSSGESTQVVASELEQGNGRLAASFLNMHESPGELDEPLVKEAFRGITLPQP